MKIKSLDILVITIILLLATISIIGLSSFDTTNSYNVLNQYGESIRIWGSGIYNHDSYFKAPILIGTDITIIFLLVPMFIFALIKEIRFRTIKTKLYLTSLNAVGLYYATSIAFGVTYNSLLILYIALFGCTFFAMIFLISEIDRKELKSHLNLDLLTNGMKVFLILSGISLFVAWLPDIIPTYFTGKSLSLIEVYTTEITYILDMGIISPIIFICLYQLKHKNIFGNILLAINLKACEIIGIMVIMQTLLQFIAGIELPIPVLITKTGIFVILSAFSLYFEIRLYKNIKI